MKKWLTAIALWAVTFSYGQNEFAATAFYNEFKKIYADAQNGFVLNKGSQVKNGFEEMALEFATKLPLPLSDSGKILYPLNGNPYVVYYFEPSNARIKIDVRAVSLKEAIVTAFAQPIYAQTETYLVDDKVYCNTYFYSDAAEENKKAALFKTAIYQQKGLFYLNFEIRGAQ